jgi:hypothetical protein
MNPFWQIENERDHDQHIPFMPGLLRDPSDQFYTRAEVAHACVAVLKDLAPGDVSWIEPSAGTGVFLNFVPEATGYDIDPKDSRIRQANFLETEIPLGCVVFGNPPFGRQSSLAKKFIQHAATRADWIGFILPRSFVKPSMQKAFPRVFHLVHTHTLPEEAFVVDGESHNVPCVFQVWKREAEPRTEEAVESPFGFIFVKKTDNYTLAFRRVGVYAGRCSLPSEALSVQSHYFIKLEDPSRATRIIAESLSHEFPTNTTGPRSLSKGEAIQFLNRA